MEVKANLLDAATMNRALSRIAHEIIEKNTDDAEVFLVGIRTRGAILAKRLATKIEQFSNARCSIGELDITFYRDDLATKQQQPCLRESQMPFDVYNKNIIIVDDVLYTGRTARCAIEAMFDLGRPSSIRLAILIDRGHRELPLRPDFIGKNVPTSRHEIVQVRVQEIDGVDEVIIKGNE